MRLAARSPWKSGTSEQTAGTSRCSGMFALARDRVTGEMPNPQLGAPGGYYVDSSQTMNYNGLQTSVRKRFSNHYSFDANYTFSKGMATQGGDLAVYSLSNVNNTQDFWDPELDRGPVVNDLRHRVNAMFIGELPELSGQNQPRQRASLAGGRCRASSPRARATR